MAIFYKLKNNKITEIETVKDITFLKDKLRLNVFETIKDIPIPEGYELISNEFVSNLDQTKKIKKEEIRSEFDYFEAEGIDGGIFCKTLGINIQCAKKDIDKVETVLTRASMGRPTPNFYIGESETISSGVTLKSFKDAYLTMTDKYVEMFKIKHDKYKAIKNATTKEEVEAI